MATTLDSPDSWVNADLKEKLFKSRTSSTQNNNRTVTSESGGSCDEVKGVMQVSMVVG